MSVILTAKEDFKDQLKKIWINETLIIKPAYPELYTVNEKLRGELLKYKSHAQSILTIYLDGESSKNKKAEWNLKIYQLGKVDLVQSLDNTLRESAKDKPELNFYNELLNVAICKRRLDYISENRIGLFLKKFYDSEKNLDLKDIPIERVKVEDKDIVYRKEPDISDGSQKGYTIINLSLKGTNKRILRLSYPNLVVFDKELTGRRTVYPLDYEELGITTKEDEGRLSKIQFNAREYYSIISRRSVRQKIEGYMTDEEKKQLEKEIIIDNIVQDLTITQRPFHFLYHREDDSSDSIDTRSDPIQWHEPGLNTEYTTVRSIFPQDFEKIGAKPKKSKPHLKDFVYTIVAMLDCENCGFLKEVNKRIDNLENKVEGIDDLKNRIEALEGKK